MGIAAAILVCTGTVGYAAYQPFTPAKPQAAEKVAPKKKKESSSWIIPEDNRKKSKKEQVKKKIRMYLKMFLIVLVYQKQKKWKQINKIRDNRYSQKNY